MYYIAEFPVAGERKGDGANGREEEGSRGSVLSGLKLAVSCLFTTSDQTLAASVLKQQGGRIYIVYTCMLLW